MNSLARTILQTCARNNPNLKLLRPNSTYKAAVLKEPSKNLIIEEKSLSKLAKDQVRIEVRYCSVNSTDCASFSDGSKKLPFVPGYELSGEVLEVGEAVTKEQIICGEKVAALSLDQFGGFSEQCILNVNDVWRLPGNVSLKDAAVLISGHSTAVYAFSNLCKPKENDSILITAGPAGLGLAAVDVAANVYKMKVYGVVDSEERGELVRQRGAFQTLKFGSKLKKEIYSKTKDKGVQIVYDAVGEHMLDSVGSCVGLHGHVFHAAPHVYTTLPVPPPNSSVCIVSLQALRKQNPELYRNIVTDTLELADEGVLAAHISATFSLKDVNGAIEYINAKKCTGKVLIEMDD